MTGRETDMRTLQQVGMGKPEAASNYSEKATAIKEKATAIKSSKPVADSPSSE